ncbi:PLP-dependent aminotransferase family protein [Hyphococcus sp. DH-69]|uniref:aminotransferase-like domain-containing protein n=1 Tax=Hyphococcus formosus TaxID=3143534 RepID=UPI00398B0761
MDWNSAFATQMNRVMASEIRERAKTIDLSAVIQLGGGLPDRAILPHPLVQSVCDTILKTDGEAALQYAPSEGYGPLREWLAAYVTKTEFPCSPDNILITNGSQQALDLIGRVFLDVGDQVVLDAPTFIGAIRAFDLTGADYADIGSDFNQPNEDSLKNSSLGYFQADFSNPGGTCYSEKERTLLSDLVNRYSLPIIEDACYTPLRYEGEPLPSIQAINVAQNGGIDNSLVFRTGTFSKTIAPSLRVGWIIGPKEAIRKITLVKQACDLSTGKLAQMIAQSIASQHFDSQCEKAVATYKPRCAAMLKALREHMPDGVSWTKPEGGFYIWLTLPDLIDSKDLANRSLTEAQVSIISGHAFFPGDGGAKYARLSFSLEPEEKGTEAIKRLSALIRSM